MDFEGPMEFEVPINQVAGLFLMDDLRSGRHAPEAWRDRASSDFWIKSVWSVLVEPSFHPSALMVVVRSNHHYGPAWLKGVLIAPSALDPTRYELPSPVDLSNWRDPVCDCLKTTSILSPDADIGGGLDGVGYRLCIENSPVRAEVSFSNPTNPDVMRLERSFLSAAATIAGLQKDQASASFLTVWREYAGR